MSNGWASKLQLYYAYAVDLERTGVSLTIIEYIENYEKSSFCNGCIHNSFVCKKWNCTYTRTTPPRCERLTFIQLPYIMCRDEGELNKYCQAMTRDE